MLKKIPKQQIILIIYLAICLLFWLKTTKTYFQQDEWDFLGRYYYYNSLDKIPFFNVFIFNFFPAPRFSFAPFSETIFAMFVQIFKLNFFGYSLISILLLWINSYLSYIFTEKISNNRQIAFLTGMLFIIGSIKQKAIVWVMASVNTQGAYLFSIISLIHLLEYLNKGKHWNLILYILFLFTGLWFKETALSIIPIVFIITFLFSIKNRFKKVTLTSIGFLVFYAILRVALSKKGAAIHVDYVPLAEYLNLSEFLQLTIWAPIRSITDNFFDPNILNIIAEKMLLFFQPQYSAIKHSTEFHLLALGRGINIATLTISSVLTVIFIKIINLVKFNREIKNTYFVALAFILSSSVISILLGIRGKSALINIQRSRDLYISSLGACLIISSIIYLIGKSKQYNSLKFIPLIILGVYFWSNYNYLHNFVLPTEITKSHLRQNVLRQISNIYPDLRNGAVFYFDKKTDSTKMQSTKLPFQTGFGRTLLVWSIFNNNFPDKSFAKDDFLYLPNSQGYKKVGDVEYGYFDNFDELIKSVSNYRYLPEKIKAFQYLEKENKVIDVTSEIVTLVRKNAVYRNFKNP